MPGMAKAALLVLRGSGILVILLGLALWAGYGYSLLQVHMLLGVLVVLALWVLAGFGAKAGASAGRVALAVVWGLILPVLGMTQTQLMPGPAHWVIRLLHLLIGIGALAQGDRLARVIKGGASAAPPAPV